MNMPMLVIDTETGGLDPTVQSILSLGCVPFDPVTQRELPLRTFHRFVAEDTIVANAKALEINQLNVGWVEENGLAPVEVVALLDTYLMGVFGPISRDNRIVLVGQNVGFDVGFLKRLYRLAGQEKHYDELFSYRTVDTAGIGRFLILAGRLPLTEASGAALAKYFGCPPVREHDALYDALSTAAVFRHLLRTQRPWWKRLFT